MGITDNTLAPKLRPFYEEVLWEANPMNARNNLNGVGDVPRDEVVDNLYFEVANEPCFGGITLEWQHHVAALIAETTRRPRRPPDAVAMNAHLRGVIDDNETKEP